MIQAVLTGDIIGSSALLPYREQVIGYLQDSFRTVGERIDSTGTAGQARFEMYRGDSFQGVLSNPATAVKAATYIRAHLISKSEPSGPSLDCRISVGVGGIEYPHEKVGLGEGEAYRLSGLGMEDLKKGKRTFSLILSEGRSGENSLAQQELRVESALFDGIAQGWTAPQAEAVACRILGYNQSAIANAIGISQGSVSRRLDGARSWAVETFFARYEEIIAEIVKRNRP